MTEFYNRRYYDHRGLDRRFYIPLKNIKIDLSRLITEIGLAFGPFYRLEQGGYSITTAKQYVAETPHRSDRYTSDSSLDENGERRLPTGERDEDIVYWPTYLEDSYMRSLAYQFSDLIGVPRPRVRMSVNPTASYHSDPHTPYRIHIALETHPDVQWMFREPNGSEHLIHQPMDGIPVLIETGTVEHNILNTNRRRRVHLWYQFHGIISDDVLAKL